MYVVEAESTIEGLILSVNVLEEVEVTNISVFNEVLAGVNTTEKVDDGIAALNVKVPATPDASEPVPVFKVNTPPTSLPVIDDVALVPTTDELPNVTDGALLFPSTLDDLDVPNTSNL